MSINNPNPHPSSRPKNITTLAIATFILGLGQAFCAGFLPSVNIIGILLGVSLLFAGVIFLFVKQLWRKELLGALINFITGALFLIIAINGALGLGVAEYKVQSLFVWIFAIVGLVYFLLGWLLLRKQLRRQ
jgi:hypothetical protein